MAKIEGIEKVLKNLNKVIDNTKKHTKGGMIKVGLEMKRISMQGTPVQFGNLRASHYVAWLGGSNQHADWKDDPSDGSKMIRLRTQHQSIISAATSGLGEFQIEVGVSAFYAAIQHENMQFNHKVGGPKFFERAIVAVTGKAEKIIGSSAKIPGG